MTRRAAPLVAFSVVVAAKIWLDGALRIVAHLNEIYDDGLYVRLAEALVRGDWLGPFDYLTLTKNPFYPMWLAATHWAGVPLLQAQSALYLLAGLLFIREMVHRGLSQQRAVAVFAVYAFNPFVEVRLLREGIYSSLLVAVIALAASAAREIGEPSKRLRSAILLGVVLSAAWLTREEGLLLVVPCAVLFAPAMFSFAVPRSGVRSVRPFAASAAAVTAVLVTSLTAVALVNWNAYGVFKINEQTSRPFASAFGAILSVEPPVPIPYRLVPPEVREQIYRESPAFASLFPFIDGNDGSREQRRFWLGLSCAYFPSSCGDYGGAWFVWTFRQAVADAGYYRSAPEADAFYARLHAEVAAACDEGRLRCGARRDSIVPPLRGEGFAMFARFAALGTAEMLAFRVRDYVYGEDAISHGDAEQLERLAWLTGSPVAPPELAAGAAGAPSQPGSARRAAGQWLAHRYAELFRPIVLLACLLYAFGLLLAAIRRRPQPFLIVGLALLAAVTTRIAMLAYLETTMFPAFTNWPAYTSPIYPLLLLFAAMAIASSDDLVGMATKAPDAPDANLP